MGKKEIHHLFNVVREKDCMYECVFFVRVSVCILQMY